ncbi:MAG: hypothetical protein WEE50_04075, partial [Chloroflexota bacterium]
WGQAPGTAEPSPPEPPPSSPAGAGPLPTSPLPGGSAWEAGGTTAGGTSGCVKALFVLLILVVIGVAAFVFFVGSFVNNLGVGENGSIGDDCLFLSDAEARAVLGGDADATELAGLYDVSIGIVIDKRVLADAPDCLVSEGNAAHLARVALYQGGDAADVVATERQRAAPTSQDQGGGITLENAGYYGGEASGIGNEAFCTGLSDAIMAGVLVRQGDRVVYVSVGPPSEGEQVPDMDITPDGVVTSPGLCALAQDLARAILE